MVEPVEPSREELERSWAITSALLAEAKDLLFASTIVAGDALRAAAEYEEYLEHNELELALDSLARAAEDCRAPSRVWRLLADAARNMELADRADELGRRSL